MKTETKKLSAFGLCIGLILATPKIVAASLSKWLLWGGVGVTVVSLGLQFTPTAPIGSVGAGVEVVGILGGVSTDPATRGVVAQLTYERSLTEFLLTDLAMLDVPDDENGPIFEGANVVIGKYNAFRKHLVAGQPQEIIIMDLLDLSDVISDLADNIQRRPDLNLTISEAEMAAGLASIETDGLPDFELEYLRRCGSHKRQSTTLQTCT